MSYLGAAESWAAGHGLRIPFASWSDRDSTSALRVFPPGFPLAIGSVIKLGLAPLTAARIVLALAAAATAATLAWLLDVVAGSLAAVLGTSAILLTPALVLDQIAVLSEPLFLACLVAALACMMRRPDRPLWYGLFAGIAGITRYAGLALGAACVAWALAQPSDARTRARRAALAGGPTLVLMLGWLVRTRLVARALPAHLVRPVLDPVAALHQAGLAVAGSLAPALEDSAWFIPVAVLASLGVVALLVRHVRRADARRLFGPLAAFGGCYALLIVIAKTFFGHDIPFDERILSPLILGLGVAVVIALARAWSAWSRMARAAAALAVLCWFGGAALSLGGLERDIGQNGYDFAGLEWRRSETLAWLRREGAGYTLFANHPVPIFVHLHRPSRDVPASIAPDTLRAFAAVLAGRPSAIVAFSDTTWEGGPWPAALAGRLGLRQAARLRDGAIWLTSGH
jgi:hypothetical protein